MLTYRTGASGSAQSARNMAEHLGQQTLSSEMAVMAAYYEQGVAPPTTADAAAGRYARFAMAEKTLRGTILDELVRAESVRLGQSALPVESSPLFVGEVQLRALAALAGAGLVDRHEAIASLTRLAGQVDEARLDAAIAAAKTDLDYTSATAAPRTDMNPALAKRLGIAPGRGLRQDEIANLLNGQRADGGEIKSKKRQSPTRALADIFGLESSGLPTKTQLQNMLSGRTAQGVPLAKPEVDRALGRFLAAMGSRSKRLESVERAHILAGRMANGTQLTDQAYRALLDHSTARTGYIDFTFSAPKSLSVAWAFAPTKAERAMLHQAHRDAVESVMRTIENEIGRARKGDGGKNGFEPGAVAWVSFDHYAARPTVEVVRRDAQHEAVTEFHTLTGTDGRVPGDMQIHTHVAVMNAVETASGRVGGLHLAQLGGRIHEFGALYQAYLATNLRQLGAEVTLDSRTEMAKLTAVPDTVEAQFSKRTVDGTAAARAYAESQGLDWDQLTPDRQVGLLKAGVQDPRGAKSDDVSDLATWRAVATKMGYGHRSVFNRDTAKPMLSRAERLEAAYQAALPLFENRFDKRAVIGGSDVRVVAAKALIASGVEAAEEVDELTRLFEARGIKRRGEDAGLIWASAPSAQGQQKTIVTTTLEEREERRLVETTAAGAKDKTAALSAEQIEQAIAAFPEIDFRSVHGQAQRRIIESLGRGGRIALTIGVAGSGKSTLLKPLVHAWREDGRIVHGVALAWRQADDLAAAGIATSETRAVAKFVKDVEAGRVRLDQKSVVVMDEIGLVGTRQLNDILAAQKKFGFQLVMIGDPKQMQSVEAGPVISLLRRALGVDAMPELETSVRQKDADERATVLMFRNGQTAEALAQKDSDGTLHIVPGGYRPMIAHVAELWQQRREANKHRPDFTITVSAPTNEEAHEISQAIRTRRRAMGEIGEDKMQIATSDREGHRVGAMALAQGDRVRLFERTNATFEGTGTVGNIGRNGSVLEVVEVRSDGLLLRNAAAKIGLVAWTTLQDRGTGNIRLAYGDALTTHTAQGSTVTEHIHAMPSGTRLVSAFGAYTSGSRHTERSFMVTSEAAERSEVHGRRPLGDPRPVTRGDIFTNMTRNLSRQPEKVSALDLIEKAADLRRGTIHGVQKALHAMEEQTAAGVVPSYLPDRFEDSHISDIIEDRLPGLAEQLRRQIERMAELAGTFASRVEAMIVSARKPRSETPRTAQEYWKKLAESTSRSADVSESLTQARKPRRGLR
jgi:hypothetical protein